MRHFFPAIALMGFVPLRVASAVQQEPPAAQQPAPAEQEPDVQEPPPLAPKPPTAMQGAVGDYAWKIDGYIKVDLLHDFEEIGSTDSFDPRTIPVTGANDPGNTTRIHARQSRLNLEVKGPSTTGEIRAFFEGDFFSDQNGFRMRHAYASLGHVLGGQTWSTFMDEDAMPETLDFESPIAFPLVRQAQVRWTQELEEDGDYWAVALEDPDSDVVGPTGVTGESDEPAPDLNARYRMKYERGHVQLSGYAGMARFDPVTGSPDDEFLWGFNLSTNTKTFGDDRFMAQVTYGDGVARYRGGTTAAPDADGDLEAIEVFGAMGSYEHHWSDEYRSTVVYSWAEGDLPAGSTATLTEEIDYLAANLIWQFSDRAWTGVEYLYGSRDTFDDESGSAERIQFALRFDI
jgi:hypothetical protein